MPPLPLAEADRCVACGLCVPGCPSYFLWQNEADGPRGRVFQALALGAESLPVTPGLKEHLGRCLACRACEAACPAGVPYGRILDAARAELVRRGHRPPRWQRLLATVLAQPLGLAAAGRGLFGVHPPRGQRRGEVTLFLGCAARLLDRATLTAAIRVLNALGLVVFVPEGQGCCGAVHRRMAATARADRLAEANRRALAGRGRPILVGNSACAAELRDYGGLADPVFDITAFLADWPDFPPLSPVRGKVLVHLPCVSRHILGGQAALSRLLSRIPELDAVWLPERPACCGQAGLWGQTHRDAARTLRSRLLADLPPAPYLVSTNFPCARWLAQGLHPRPRVLHPVRLMMITMGSGL